MDSYFDRTGIVPAACGHGLAQHPDPRVQGSPIQKFVPLDKETGEPRRGSWIRSKHLDGMGRCPVCRGEERPADLTEPRDG